MRSVNRAASESCAKLVLLIRAGPERPTKSAAANRNLRQRRCPWLSKFNAVLRRGRDPARPWPDARSSSPLWSKKSIVAEARQAPQNIKLEGRPAPFELIFVGETPPFVRYRLIGRR